MHTLQLLFVHHSDLRIFGLTVTILCESVSHHLYVSTNKRGEIIIMMMIILKIIVTTETTYKENI